MENISDVQIEPLKDSLFIKPLRMRFKQNGNPRIWDLVTVHESVAIIVFNVERKKMIFVKQFRPAVYYSKFPKAGFLVDENVSYDASKLPGSEGITLELCAGIVDTTKDLTVTAQTEVLEECGYRVPLERFQKVKSFRAGVGISGERQTIFYVEVDDSMKDPNAGGGVAAEGEMIEVIELSIPEVQDMMNQPHVNSPSGLLFGVMWFLQNKAHLHQSP